jgi:predicted AAA+ superfamily ATPase
MDALDLYGLNQGLILTEDEEYEITTNHHRVIVQPVWKWLLEKGSQK